MRANRSEPFGSRRHQRTELFGACSSIKSETWHLYRIPSGRFRPHFSQLPDPPLRVNSGRQPTKRSASAPARCWIMATCRMIRGAKARPILEPKTASGRADRRRSARRGNIKSPELVGHRVPIRDRQKTPRRAVALEPIKARSSGNLDMGNYMDMPGQADSSMACWQQRRRLRHLPRHRRQRHPSLAHNSHRPRSSRHR